MNEYNLEYNGLSLDPANGYTVYLQDGTSGAPIRMSSDVLTGQDGGVVYATRYGPRVIVVEGTVHTSDPVTFFQKRRELINAFSRTPLTKPLVITFWDGQVFTTDAAVQVTPQIIDRTGKRTQINFRVELFCPDSFLNVGTVQTFTLQPQGGKRGFPLPAPLPMPIGQDTGGTIAVINNVGDTPVVPRFRLDGQINNAVVTNMTTGQSFSIITDIPNSRFVEIFVENGEEYVLLDGTTTYYQNFIGDIFPIVQGNNTIRVTASSSDADALLTISYQDQRNGV